MTFEQFCKSHGLIINSLVSNGKWQRVPTESHPRKTNGAYVWDGFKGACQDWATMERPIAFKSDAAPTYIDRKALEASRQKAEQDKRKLQMAAAKKAGFIVQNSTLQPHRYLMKKGFPELQGLVYEQKLVVPMRKDNAIVGCQLISEEGEKRFLYGQITAHATHVMGRSGVNIVCEGYATALSIQNALRLSGMRYVIHVCFSAGNMLKVARLLKPGICIADNDASGTGERIANEIGWPYWISDRVGEDFNDAYTSMNRLRLSQTLKKMLMSM